MLHGVDIHGRYQKDLVASRLENVDFVITKATGGKNFVIKRTYNADGGTLRQNSWEDMLSGAELVGIYHYAKEKGYAGSAAEEAANFITQANKRPDAVLFLDWEEDDKNDADWALEWLRLVEAGTGRTPIFYTYHAILRANPALSRIKDAGYKLWYARYPYSTKIGWQNYDQPMTVPYWERPTIWQYSSAGGLDDYNAPLDLNIFYGDASDWQALVGKESLVTRTPTQAVSWAKTQIGSKDYPGMCEKFVRTSFGLPAMYPTATAAYLGSKADGTIYTDKMPPAGVPVYWSIPGNPAGHVALSIGGGKAISTSNENMSGANGIVTIDISRYKGGYRGWSDFYHGKRVYTKPVTVVTSSKPKPSASTLYKGKIDGKFEAMSIESWQAWLKRRGYYAHAIDGVMEVESWKAVQRWLTNDGYYNRAIDGKPGEWTIKGVQNALQNAGYYKGFKVDGVFGTETVKALQEYLSTHL